MLEISHTNPTVLVQRSLNLEYLRRVRANGALSKKDTGVLPPRSDQSGFLLRAQRDIGCSFIDKPRDFLAVTRSRWAIMRFLLQEYLTTDDLIDPVAPIATRDTSPVGFILREQELTTPAAVRGGKG